MNTTTSVVLLVDDIAANRETLVELLEPQDYRLVEAADGPEALKLAAESPPDLVLLDVMMPGMDGYEVCRRLRADALLAEVPIIMITALDDQASRLTGIEAGADDFITKPFNRAELRARVRTITRLNRYRRLMQAQERIHEQARWLDEARDAIFVRDLEDRITYWNDGATRLFGWTREEVQGRRAAELMHNDKAPFNGPALLAARDNGDWQGEVRKITKAGREVIVASRLTLLRDPRREPCGMLCINTDITEKKQAEKLMLRTQRLESIGTLVSGVAHDLNNALAPILMGVEILRMQYPDQTQLIDAMETSARRGANMVQQVLTFAKGVEGARLLVQPQHLLREMEKIMKSTFPKNLQLQTKFSRELRTLLGDATQLHQVLLNLCVNARDAMPNGGTLTLEAENAEIDATYASAVPEAKPGSYVVWRVKDTGTGIPQEIIDRIFEPFFSTKGPDKGTGLGLSTVLGIVKSHGGFIQIYSVLAKGSTFAVYLPAEGSRGSDTTQLTKVETTFRGNGETILVVDDEVEVRNVLRAVLTRLNFKVLTASDGTAALIQMAENRTELRVVITDLHMPHMDGFSFVRMLKGRLPQTGIIVTSGRLDERDVNEFKKLGVSALLDKPFTQEKLMEALEMVFQK